MTTKNIFVNEDTGRDPLSQQVIGAVIEVHRVLEPGLLESAYEDCVEYELREMGLGFAREVPLTIQYKTQRIANGYKLDFVVEGQLIVELKAVERVLWIHEAQWLTYLKLRGIKRGILLNFNVPLLKDGIKPMVC